jgi:hypothetical protein
LSPQSRKSLPSINKKVAVLFDVEFQAIRTSLLGRWGTPENVGHTLEILRKYVLGGKTDVEVSLRAHRVLYLLEKGPDDNAAVTLFERWTRQRQHLDEDLSWEDVVWDWEVTYVQLLDLHMRCPRAFSALFANIHDILENEPDRSDRKEMQQFYSMMEQAVQIPSLVESSC